MATITIINGINDQGSSNAILISAFQRQSMNYLIDRGAATGTYSTVMIGTYEFRAVYIGTSGTEDEYLIDLTSVLSNYIGESPATTSNIIVKEFTPVVKLYDAIGNVLDLFTLYRLYLCFGYPDINSAYGMSDVLDKGSSRPIYHNGKISFFWGGTDGLIKFVIGGVEYNYSVFENTYITCTLDSTQNINGTLTSESAGSLGTFSIPLYYKQPYGEHEIAWLNRDGGWSFWNFRQVSSEIKVKKSNEVATYYPRNYETISKSRMISAEKTVEYVFDTLAYNPEHFAQLCEIQESLAVFWNNKLMMVSGCNSLTAVCKQNLRFTLKLEIDENIAGY